MKIGLTPLCPRVTLGSLVGAGLVVTLGGCGTSNKEVRPWRPSEDSSRSRVSSPLEGGGGSDSAAQTTDYTHQWVRGYGSAEGDFGRGVAVWYDGTAITASEVRGQVTPDPTVPRGEVAFLDRAGGAELWRAVFQPDSLVTGSACAALAVAAGCPDVEGNPSSRFAYSTGWLTGRVQFDPPTPGPTLTAGTARNAFVVRMNNGGALGNFVIWATQFVSASANEGLCVAVSAPCGSCGGAPGASASMSGGSAFASFAAGTPPPPAGCLCSFVAVGGYYSGETRFGSDAASPTLTPPIGNGEDACITLLYAPDLGSGSPGGLTQMVLGLGGVGADRVTGIAVDPKTNDVVVTGTFTSGAIDFDPGPGIVGPLPGTFPGGTNIFVAKYRINEVAGVWKLVLYWRWTAGTTGDDGAASVALDSAGDVYVTGSLADAGGKGDLWLAKLAGFPVSTPNTAVLWQHNWPGVGDDRGHGVAIDGLDRVLVTGQFGRDPSGDQFYCLDFDPSPNGTDQRCVGGLLDLFVSRFRPDGSYDWTFTLGSTYSEVGSAIAVDPAATGRLVHTGWFGAPDATSAYAVDFDPGAAIVNLSSAGKADVFVNGFDPTDPVGVQFAVSLVIDNSGSMSGQPGEDYDILMNTLHAVLDDANAQTGVPRNGTVGLNVVFYGLPNYAGEAVPVMPWTVLTPQTAPLFADRVRQQRRLTQGSNLMDEGVTRALTSLQESGIDPSAYASMLVIADQNNYPDDVPGSGAAALRAARDASVASDKFDQICAYAVREGSIGGFEVIWREYCLENLVKSVATVPNNPPPENYLAFAGEPDLIDAPGPLGFQSPEFARRLRQMIWRLTLCPGDYTRDGAVQFNDLDTFNDHSEDQAIPPSEPCDNPASPWYPLWCKFADWNFNDIFDGHVMNGLDRNKFIAGFPPVFLCP